MEFVGFFLAGVIFFAFIVLFAAYIFNPKTGRIKTESNRLNPELISQRWVDVQAMVAQGGPANYRQAIMEGDKLIDSILRSEVAGETMGERLKNARRLFSHKTYEGLWTAHKIRNKIAHEADFEGLSSDAKLCVRNFEKALKEMRAI